MIAILLPTRGLIFEQTIKSVSNIPNSTLITVSGMPIPEAQNWLVTEALGAPDVTHLYFVEEDMEIPEGTLEKMLDLNKDVVCVDYPVNGGWSTIKRVDREIQHCGLGCTLVKREVFERLSEPWFRTDKSVDAKTEEIMDIPMKYGGHDIFFGIAVRKAGYKITQLEGVECGHLRCEQLVRREDNDNRYEIRRLDKISKYQND